MLALESPITVVAAQWQLVQQSLPTQAAAALASQSELVAS